MYTYVWEIHVPDTYADSIYIIVRAKDLVEAREKATDYIKKEFTEDVWNYNKYDIEAHNPIKEILDDVFSLDKPFN